VERKVRTAGTVDTAEAVEEVPMAVKEEEASREKVVEAEKVSAVVRYRQRSRSLSTKGTGEGKKKKNHLLLLVFVRRMDFVLSTRLHGGTRER
jgi:hypothetical protein